ncbi:hypothetical protein GCM10009775_30670 [Microbacterium aoyamense]|uniref:DUF4258 domain-containing protein n=2 Tax=Microbacterium TaxID=33882 RepID=A0A7D4UJ49_9MICO|nr:DUF4258 domain-containing protein [Microbacterium hominis]QKJ19167.1 DUF4258 domain-containing protein [Microbacterium hominis]
MSRVIVTTHAAEKMVARGITLTEVEQCVQQPEVVYGNQHGEVRQRGSIACGVLLLDDAGVVVRTVLYRHQARWNDEQARTRGGHA